MKRTTRQQETILTVLKEESHPLTAYEILNRSIKTIQSINLSTIYRNIKSLLETNKLRRIEIPGDTPRYEIKDEKSYDYFLCDTCTQVFRVHSNIIIKPNDRLEGFLIKKYCISVYGTCVDCNNPS